MRAFFQKYRNSIDTVVLLLLFAFGGIWMYHTYVNKQTQLHIAEKILRFHVRANSDSRKDQELKLKVRDAVGTYMNQELTDIDSLEECTQIVQKHLPDIIGVAEKVIAREGFHYPVSAKVESVEFPEKTYGEYTFPSGCYQALNVVIGSGRGHNWWCVMYPNMCFHGAVYEEPDKEASESLQRVLSEDEYAAVLKSRKYRIRFKFIEKLNQIFEKGNQKK